MLLLRRFLLFLPLELVGQEWEQLGWFGLMALLVGFLFCLMAK